VTRTASARSLSALGLLTAVTAAVVLALPAGAGAQTEPVPTPPTTEVLVTPDNCGPGNIVRLPNCGDRPDDAGDPGGSLQVALFFMVCAVILLILGGLIWRSRVLRRRRAAAGVDAAAMARARDEAFRGPPPPQDT
jgi:hypothetical protein